MADDEIECELDISNPEPGISVNVGLKEDDGCRDVVISWDGVLLLRSRLTVEEADQRAGAIEEAFEGLGVSDLDLSRVERDLVAKAVAVDNEFEAAVRAVQEALTAQPAAGDKQSAAQQLLKFVPVECLFHTQDDRGFATLGVGNERRTLLIESRAFSKYLVGRYLDVYQRAPSEQAVKEAVASYDALAIHRGKLEDVFLRYAELHGKLYVDLANPECGCIEIDSNGWRECREPPVRFVRPASTLPLPRPIAGGSFELLKQHVNVTAAQWPLLAGFALAATMPRGPYPVLMVHGEQGTAKSTTLRMLGKVIDPRHASLRSEVRNMDDIPILAANSHLLLFDNLSYVRDDVSDLFCRLSTGGGFGKRKLYSNDEEVLVEFSRPVVMNGICEVVNRADLLDRSMILHLPRISDADRRTEAEINREFEKDLPLILGGLYDALSESLRNRGTVKLKKKPRLMDVAVNVVAAEPALGLQPGEFMAAYDENRSEAHLHALEASPVFRALAIFTKTIPVDGTWEGIPSDLLSELRMKGRRDDVESAYWPKNAKSLTDKLNRLAPNLAQIGITIERHRESGSRTVILKRLPAYTAAYEAMFPRPKVMDPNNPDEFEV